MNISDRDTSPGAYATSVPCMRCGRMTPLTATVCDGDGPSFAAYFCTPTLGFHMRNCVPFNDTEAAQIYRYAGYEQSFVWRKKS